MCLHEGNRAQPTAAQGGGGSAIEGEVELPVDVLFCVGGFLELPGAKQNEGL